MADSGNLMRRFMDPLNRVKKAIDNPQGLIDSVTGKAKPAAGIKRPAGANGASGIQGKPAAGVRRPGTATAVRVPGRADPGSTATAVRVPPRPGDGDGAQGLARKGTAPHGGAPGPEDGTQTPPPPEQPGAQADAAVPAEAAGGGGGRIKLLTVIDPDSGLAIIDSSREAIARLRERIAQAGELLTAPGGIYERRPELRDILALFQDGLFLISRSHTDDPHVASFEGLLRRKGIQVEKVAVDMGIIREVYQGLMDQSSAVRADASSTTMQRDILRFIADVTKLRTSDAHIVVNRDNAEVRIRADGVMRPFLEWRSSYGADFLAAVFAMADASDSSYQPYEYQAARVSDATVRLPKGLQAIRLQFNPLAYGGRHCVMRFLYKGSEEVRDVDTLGYNQLQIAYLQKMRALPMGINIIAGPTGSGKSTTLQRSLSSLLAQRDYEVSVFTVEDPPEYQIRGAQQMPVTNAPTPEERAIKFSQAISAALRSDPDVIMIGEIRDSESAKLAFEAAMTGHQVWTTLHATDAVTILSRLKDIGVEAYKLYDPGILTGLVCQRLVRTLCRHCARPIEDAIADGSIDPAVVERLTPAMNHDLSGIRVRGPGCDHCKGSGISGRTVVSECVLPDQRFMQFLQCEDRPGAISYWMRQEGSLTMMLHGLEKVKMGILAPEELERVLGPVEPWHKLDKSNFVT